MSPGLSMKLVEATYWSCLTSAEALLPSWTGLRIIMMTIMIYLQEVVC
jgi:hypothetical protein